MSFQSLNMSCNDLSSKVREGRSGMVSDAENCEPNISEVMLMVQVSIFTSFFSLFCSFPYLRGSEFS